MELFTPEFGLIFWMFVSFAVLFLVLAKWGWPAIMKMIEGRADLIDKGVEYAQNAKEQLDHAREEAEKYIEEARKQQADMLRDADRMKTQIIEEARGEAQKEAKKQMEAAQVAIEQARKEAELRFRDEVSAFALDIATKVVRKQMADEKAQSQLVNSLLDEIENKN
ncbi:MAG TPA: F0F1 ATP synthase subunit B [Muribaculum sp.]|jgi:F-type H+-transporting ATPase subunit b|uniref:ATP synthase subunit b n=1 Tax=Heminiphilus faecis TaxID=2601703 RepID=A0ABV4CUT0_9BACT|nr:F0F1 ATP synthase subunit B [Heminiphilus faecis]RLT77022.1 ATP synthase F0 subunit B [bacterium J10(2018)]HRF68922.1 F0F1 ATP synthase subunit B [Muribaculum sp.]